MLEASGFDFRNRYPQRLVLKVAKQFLVDRETVGKTAYNISLDLYRIVAPLKQTAPTMAVACVELAGRLREQHVRDLEAGKGYKRWHITRPEVMGMLLYLLFPFFEISVTKLCPETLLDLLDLYTHHRASTLVGQDHALEKFISIRIALNQEASSNRYPRHTQSRRKKVFANGANTENGVKDLGNKKDVALHMSPRDTLIKEITSPTPNGVLKPGFKDGTVRFMLNPQRAMDENLSVAEFFKEEEEEYEVDVEVKRERRRH